MKRNQSPLEQRLLLVFLAFMLGLLFVVLGVALFESQVLVGAALVWILAVLLYAAHVLRCPLCGATLLYFPVRTAWRWLRESPRKCPRCRTDYEAAVAELASGKGRSS